MKIVINSDYGGFGLSDKAMREYFRQKQGIEIYSYKSKPGSDIYEQVVPIDTLFVHYCTLDQPTLTSKELNEHYITDYDIARNDPILVSIVEEMGKEASGDLSSLKIVEIPDGTKWCIREYDGAETVEEVHRSWS